MNTKRILMGGLVVAGFGLFGAAHAQSPLGRTIGGFQPGTDFTCESSEGRYRECRLDGRRNVRLQRQLSRTACIEGQTWGVRRDVVWVDRGCRGQFAATSWQGNQQRDDQRHGDRGRWNNNPRGGSVICESVRSRLNRCAINTRRGVVMVRQLSDTRCREGHNWGVGNGEVWVDHGCRAEFAPANQGRGWQQGWGYGNNYGHSGYGPPPQIMQCSSNDGRQRYCRAEIHRDVQLSRQLSRADCIRGRTWGWDRGGVWVNSGCRAEFMIR